MGKSQQKKLMEKIGLELAYEERVGFSHTEKERHSRLEWVQPWKREGSRGAGGTVPSIEAPTPLPLPEHNGLCTDLCPHPSWLLAASSYLSPPDKSGSNTSTLKKKRHRSWSVILFLCKLTVTTYLIHVSRQVFLLSWKHFENQLRFYFNKGTSSCLYL